MRSRCIIKMTETEKTIEGREGVLEKESVGRRDGLGGGILIGLGGLSTPRRDCRIK